MINAAMQNDETFTIKKKHVIIVASTLLILALVYFLGRSATNYAVYENAQKDVTGDITECKNNLSACHAGLSGINASLAECENDYDNISLLLGTCSSEKMNIKNIADAANSNLMECEANNKKLNYSIDSLQAKCDKTSLDYESLKISYAGLQSQYNSTQENYVDMAENYAIDVCCSRGLNSISWSVINNEIVCTGANIAICP